MARDYPLERYAPPGWQVGASLALALAGFAKTAATHPGCIVTGVVEQEDRGEEIEGVGFVDLDSCMNEIPTNRLVKPFVYS